MAEERVITADEQDYAEWQESPDFPEYGALLIVGENGDFMRGQELVTFESATRIVEAKKLTLYFRPVDHEGEFPNGTYVHIDDGNEAALEIVNPHRYATHVTTGVFYHHPKYGLMVQITPLLRPSRLALTSFCQEDHLRHV